MTHDEVVEETIAKMYFHSTVLAVLEHLEQGGEEAEVKTIVKDIHKRARQRMAESEQIEFMDLIKVQQLVIQVLDELDEEQV